MENKLTKDELRAISRIIKGSGYTMDELRTELSAWNENCSIDDGNNTPINIPLIDEYEVFNSILSMEELFSPWRVDTGYSNEDCDEEGRVAFADECIAYTNELIDILDEAEEFVKKKKTEKKRGTYVRLSDDLLVRMKVEVAQRRTTIAEFLEEAVEDKLSKK